jgi:hypothetical protein
MLLTGRIFFITTHVLPRLLPPTPAEYDTILLAIAETPATTANSPSSDIS